MSDGHPDRIVVGENGSVRPVRPVGEWDDLAPTEVPRNEVVYVREDRMRSFVKAVSCRCASQINKQRVDNRQRAALVALFRMELPPEAALIVERALYDQGHKEPSLPPSERTLLEHSTEEGDHA